MAKLVIVDDEAFVHLLYKKLEEYYGHEILGEAFDGKEAVELITKLKDKPEIVLMDQMMPIMDGVEATKKLVSLYPEMNIVFVSADFTAEKKAQDAGATLFLEKPKTVSELNEILVKMVNE